MGSFGSQKSEQFLKKSIYCLFNEATSTLLGYDCHVFFTK